MLVKLTPQWFSRLKVVHQLRHSIYDIFYPPYGFLAAYFYFFGITILTDDNKNMIFQVNFNKSIFSGMIILGGFLCHMILLSILEESSFSANEKVQTNTWAHKSCPYFFYLGVGYNFCN
jgi:hypothetical protein